MFCVTRELDFCYGHRLLNYAGKCRHLHGHNARVLITIEANRLNEQGMVLDFGDIKRAVQGWIDENLDHKMILSRDDPMVPTFEQRDEPLYVIDTNPTAENLAKLIGDKAIEAGFPVVEVRFWETPRCYATYRP
ncbi:MAG TPA: 6-carboxytetrahydropterin synthase [Thermoguttaceae bacterium]|nr:6-carboxytetrahydropterin synthase [Thermoguttaceae bacterium]